MEGSGGQVGGDQGGIWREGIVRTHGCRPQGKASKTYVAWREMRARCRNPQHQSYRNYGGRGITVCPEWEDFSVFLTDMGEAPLGMSIDRRNNNAGYCKANCRWATPTQQNQNSRWTRLITYKGATLCLSVWARRLGLDVSSLVYRLDNWPLARALGSPVTCGGPGAIGGRHG